MNQTTPYYFPPTPEKKKIPWILILAVSLGVIIVAFVVVFFLQKTSFEKKLNQNQKEIQELNKEVQRLKDLRDTIKVLEVTEIENL